MAVHTEARVHPSADVAETAELGAGTRVWNRAQVREGARLGANCIVGKDAYIDFGVQVGDNVKIQNAALVYHGVTVEDGVFIGPGAILTNDRHPRAVTPDGRLQTDADWTVGEIRLCRGASIGAGAIVLPGVTVGAWAMVGAGAVVTKDVAPNQLVAGNPARPMGRVCRCGARLGDDPQAPCPSCRERYDQD